MTFLSNRRQLLKVGGAAAGALAMPGDRFDALAQSSPVASPIQLDKIFASDPRYGRYSRGFNQRWVGTPKYIALCQHAGQVQQAVPGAIDGGLRLTVRSGGHCYEDFASGNDGGVIVDLSPMTKVWRDDGSGDYGVESGARLLDVYTTLADDFGVTIPGGSCSSVGAGGHITGGGYGLLSRLHGLTVDYLYAVELVHVTQDGKAEIVIAKRDDPDTDLQDLLWGHTGGGGGNFGIVTKFLVSRSAAAAGSGACALSGVQLERSRSGWVSAADPELSKDLGREQWSGQSLCRAVSSAGDLAAGSGADRVDRAICGR